MKGLITIIFAFITLNLSAQDLTYEQAQDITFTRTIKNGTKFNSYKCENGTLINIGWLTGSVVNVNLLTSLLGLILFMYALSRLFGLNIRIPPSKEPVLSVLFGGVNGVLTGFTGSVMVPSVLYMQALGFRKDMLVQAMNVFFGLSILVFMISLGRNDLLSADEAMKSTIALIPSFVGIFVGRGIRNRIDEVQFQKIFLIGMLCLGLYILSKSGLALL